MACAIDMTLPLNSSLEVQKNGRRSSVCQHPTKDFAVSVYDTAFEGAIYYSVFEVNKASGSKVLTPAVAFTEGKHPSVTLLYNEERDVVVAIATKRDFITKTFYYHLGILDANTKTITWNFHTDIEKGVKPKVCASSNKVAVVYEERFTFHKVRYHIGILVVNDQADNHARNAFSIEWKTNMRIPNFDGVEPDMDMNETTAVFISRTGFNNLQTKVGKFVDEACLDWGPTVELTTTGINPTISMNSKGYVVEIHQSKFFRQLCRNQGYIQHSSKTVLWKQDAAAYTMGEFPSVSISDSDFVLEMHKTHFGTKLFHSQGRLVVTERTHGAGEEEEEEDNREEEEETET